MATEPITQTINQIKSAGNILILASSGSNLDSVAAGLALKEFLSRQEKQVRVLTPTPLLPKLSFLPESSQVQSGQSLIKNFVIEVGLQKTQLSELAYQKQDDVLKILLTPKSGEFEASDVNVRGAVYPFDLIITLGLNNLEELGQLYANNAQMFFDIPVINIDYKPSNENFGKINVVSLISSAVSEIVFDLINEYDPNFIDEKIATLLLAGLVYQTNSFQSQKTSPQVFGKASKLVSLGGKQQEIISQLYRSKSLGLLHLWGRVLARLKQDTENNLVYSEVSAQDIERSNAESSDLDEIILEMTQSLSFAKYFVFMAEQGTQTTVFAAGGAPVNLANLFAAFQPQVLSQQTVKFIVPKTLNDTETEIITTLQQELAKYRS